MRSSPAADWSLCDEAIQVVPTIVGINGLCGLGGVNSLSFSVAVLAFA